MTNTEKARIEIAIRDFCHREYTQRNITNMDENKIPIAYTTMGAVDEFEVNVYVNLKKLSIDVYRDGELVDEIRYDSAEDLAQEIEACDFMDIIQGWDNGLSFNWIVVPYSPNHTKMCGVEWEFTTKENAEFFVVDWKDGVHKDRYGFEWKLEIENIYEMED